MNIIADIAGQHKALVKLMAKMPNEEFIFLADLVDRGPDSDKVVELAMNHRCVLGNHEHMMIDYLDNSKIYQPTIWFRNGGYATLKSYEVNPRLEPHLAWLKSLPTYIETDKVFISHAPWHHDFDLEMVAKPMLDVGFGGINSYSLIWNREEPRQREKLQVFGHNSHWGLKYFGSEKDPWAICLDDSRRNRLTGLNLTTMKIYQEDFR